MGDKIELKGNHEANNIWRKELKKLAWTLNAGDSADDIGHKLYQRFTEKDFRRYLDQTLGIGVAGIVTINPRSKELIPLFSMRGKGRAFFLPYCQRDNRWERYEQVITEMFVAWRLQESLSEPLPSDKFPPEYIFYLPRQGENNLASSEAHSTWTVREQKCCQENECHYVTKGEILAFLIIWRVLLRLLQAGSGTLGDLLMRICKNVRTHPPCSDMQIKLWERGSPLSDTIREKKWMDHVNNLDKEIVDNWYSLVERFDNGNTPEEMLIRDLTLLGVIGVTDNIISNDNPPNLESLLRYGFRNSVAVDPGGHICSTLVEGTKVKMDHLLSKILEVATSILPLSVNWRDWTAQQAVTLLRKLSNNARFPLLPYFYWCILDGSVKSHLVFPVWESHAGAYQVRKYRGEGDMSFDNSKLIKEIMMGAAVVGVDPISYLDWTVDNQGDFCDPSSRSRQRLAETMEFLKIIASPAVDQAFLRLVDEQRDRDAVRYANRLRHTLGGRMTSLRSSWRLLKRRIGEEYPDQVSDFEEDLEFFLEGSFLLRNIADYVFDIDLIELGAVVLKASRLWSRYNMRASVSEPDRKYWIRGDRDHLDNVVRQLLNNAADAIHGAMKGKEESRIEVYMTATDQNVNIHIRDNGPGVSPVILDLLYKPYESWPEANIGLGLAYCKQVVERHNGTLSLNNSESEGAHFVISIPLQRRISNETSTP